MAKLQARVRTKKVNVQTNSKSQIKRAKTANKVAYTKKKRELKLQRMEADNKARIAKTQLKATIKSQKAGKKYGFDPNLSNEQRVQLKMAEMKHNTARLATTEATGSVTSLAGGLGGASISMQQAHFGRENEPTVPNSPSNRPSDSSSGSPNSPSLDDILAGIGR